MYIYVRSDGHSAKKWQSTDAGVQSHVLKSVGAFVGCLSNELLKFPPIKVNLLYFSLRYYALLSCYPFLNVLVVYSSRMLCINMKIRL
jgi:hypothetical protein